MNIDLEQIKQAAFEDEMEKIAASCPGGKIRSKGMGRGAGVGGGKGPIGRMKENPDEDNQGKSDDDAGVEQIKKAAFEGELRKILIRTPVR